jgi:hypothetical protein
MSYLLIVFLVTSYKESIVEIRETNSLQACKSEGRAAAAELFTETQRGVLHSVFDFVYTEWQRDRRPL